MSFLILAVNPGSTSTKVAVYRDRQELFSQSVTHERGSLPESVAGQLGPRTELVLRLLGEHGILADDLSCVVGRGGMLPPVKAGGYIVNDEMLRALTDGRSQPHSSNLGAMIASEICRGRNIPAFIYDAVSAVELSPMARITGIPEVTRRGFCHVLNSRATARKYAESIGRRYEEMSFVVAHLGGGISVSAHKNGEIIDAAGDDDGPFSPERSGGLPLTNILDLCYSGHYTKEQMLYKIRGMGGLRALLGTSDCAEIERRALSGDEYARLVYSAQGYQIAKGVGIMATTLKGQVDAVILTGGVAHSRFLTDFVTDYVSYLAPVAVMPGENEMEALAMGALRILLGQEIPHSM